MTDIQKEWVSGFVDSEGCIEMHTGKNSNMKINYFTMPKIEIPQFSSEFVAGWIDGDGSIRTQISPTERRKIGFQVQPKITSKQTGCGALNAMSALENFCKESGVEYNIDEIKREGNESSGYNFRIGGLSDVKTFLLEIEESLIVKQPQAKIMLNEIIPRMENKKHLEKDGFVEIVAWKDIMDSYKGGNNRSKYNLDYFKEEWDINYKVI